MNRLLVICLTIAVAMPCASLLVPGASAEVPTVTDAAQCNEQARRTTGRPTGATDTLTPAPGTRTDRSGSIIAESPDPLLEGMAAAGLADPDYRMAYRACMAARARSLRAH